MTRSIIIRKTKTRKPRRVSKLSPVLRSPTKTEILLLAAQDARISLERFIELHEPNASDVVALDALTRAIAQMVGVPNAK